MQSIPFEKFITRYYGHPHIHIASMRDECVAPKSTLLGGCDELEVLHGWLVYYQDFMVGSESGEIKIKLLAGRFEIKCMLINGFLNFVNGILLGGCWLITAHAR